jgi:hypothetical protein
MKNALLDLVTSKKFLAALTAIIVYVAGRFGFNVDTAVLDRICAALLVYIGAQGIADNGKSAAQITASAATATATASPAPSTAAGPRLTGAGISGAAVVLLAIGLGSMASVLSPAQP